jgi:HAD superfamily hydrolase (TIGR01459 family)
MSIPPVYTGIGQIAERYDHFIIDIWGVLHDGLQAYAGVIDAMAFLKAEGKQTLLLSNSPNRSQRVVDNVVTPIGIAPDMYDHIITSGEASWAHIKAQHEHQKVYVLWHDEQPTALVDTNVKRVYDITQADFIYGSLIPREATSLSYQDILAQALARQIPFVCGNPDRVVGIGDTLYLCAGTFAEQYEAMGGHVVWIGKPYPTVYEQAWASLGRPDKSRILAIGDSLLTDVAGARNFGCDVLWNVTGIHWEELKSDHAVHQVDAQKVLEALAGHALPTGLLQGFKV